MFRTVPSVHHQEFFTVRTAMVYVIQVCCAYSEKLWWWTGNCPKHVEFHSKNKFEKLVHLVGFILRKLMVLIKCVELHSSSVSSLW